MLDASSGVVSSCWDGWIARQGDLTGGGGRCESLGNRGSSDEVRNAGWSDSGGDGKVGVLGREVRLAGSTCRCEDGMDDGSAVRGREKFGSDLVLTGR
jgi:hypothetical protein